MLIIPWSIVNKRHLDTNFFFENHPIQQYSAIFYLHLKHPMKALLVCLTLLLSACSTFSSQSEGSLNIHTVQMGAWEVKALPYTSTGSYLKKGIVRVKTREGQALFERSFNRGQLIFSYPIHEAAILIEVEAGDLKGSTLFFRNELRDIEV